EGHRARKRFGQNFLHDEYWISRIARAVDAQPGEFIVEIGPGQAALTRELVGGAGHVNAVEIDRDLAAWLKTQFAESELTLIEADALTLDWTAVAGEKRMRVVGNLPYNISSPLLFHLMKAASCVIDQHFMLQREVVDRMTAAPGTKTYGRLSVMLQWRYKMHKLFDVPPGAFTPAPKVVSSVVRMIPRRAEEVLPVDFDMLSSVVANAFGQRRKTLRNALSVLLTEEEIRAAGVDPQERAEKLPLIHFVNLANKASELKRKPVIQGAQASDE
ncbi:16S rRNA (adenine(1518)-N(6)/adenine(1519)-N(6))-dimethyltransferase RsmA, partial [Duodenibacillus massiliensis]